MKSPFLVLRRCFLQIAVLLAILSALIVVPGKVCNAMSFSIESIEFSFIPSAGENTTFFDTSTTNAFSDGNPVTPLGSRDDGDGPDYFEYTSSWTEVEIIEGIPTLVTKNIEDATYNLNAPQQIGTVTVFNGIVWTADAPYVDELDIVFIASILWEDGSTELLTSSQHLSINRTPNLGSPDENRDLWILSLDGTSDPLTDSCVDCIKFDPLEGLWQDPGGTLIATFTQNSPLNMQITNIIPFEGSNFTVVPEPTTIALLGIGLVGLAGGAARQRFKSKKGK